MPTISLSFIFYFDIKNIKNLKKNIPEKNVPEKISKKNVPENIL